MRDQISRIPCSLNPARTLDCALPCFSDSVPRPHCPAIERVKSRNPRNPAKRIQNILFLFLDAIALSQARGAQFCKMYVLLPMFGCAVRFIEVEAPPCPRSSMSKNIQKYYRKRIQTCPNMSKRVQTYLKVSKSCKTCPKVSKII